MSYFRLYPKQNTTIFIDSAGNSTSEIDGTINTGANPVMELSDGYRQSYLLFEFDLEPIITKLTQFNYTCNFKLFDAGAQYESILEPKELSLYYFEDTMVEGGGYKFYTSQGAKTGFANWLTLDGINPRPDFNTLVNTFQPINHHDDLFFQGLESAISIAINNGINPKFAIGLTNPDSNIGSTFKFIYSRHTRTIRSPYIEFFIDDLILDNRFNCIGDENNSLYIQTKSKNEIQSVVSCDILNKDKQTLGTYYPTYMGNGYYKIDFTPISSDEILYDVWSIGGTVVQQNLISIKNPNELVVDKFDNAGLFFYPITNYTHQQIKKGDIAKFNIISQIRGKGEVLDYYEYRVVCSNTFEMIPWQPASIFRNEIFFYLDTRFLFEDLNYEVHIRKKDDLITQSSSFIYKFRLLKDGPIHLDGKAASPYNDRNWMGK